MKSVGIVGFRGYSGAELVSILDRHTGVTPVLMEHRADSQDRPRPRGWTGPQRIPCNAAAAAEHNIELVLMATPAEVSMELAPAMLEAGIKVVDLSGAFRLGTPENYRRWYGAEHTAPELLKQAVYGLPEVCREQVRNASLIANPGCYPTAANLAIRPLVQAGVVDASAGIVCDAKSGVSGAGRKASLKTSFCEVVENFSAYSLLDHRHIPEVLNISAVAEADFSFTAQLLPLDRGILETIYVRLNDKADLMKIYSEAYSGEPFVRLYEEGQVPDLAAVQRTNFCDIGVKVHPSGRSAVIVSAIDNLVKGAAGQAVQNMNLMLGFPETEALL